MKPPMKNIFSFGRLEKCNFVVRRGTASRVRKHGPEPRGRHLPRRGNRGGFGREPRGRGGRLSQLTKRSADFLPARGRGGTCWCFTLFCVLSADPASDRRSTKMARFSLRETSLRYCLPTPVLYSRWCPKPTRLYHCKKDLALTCSTFCTDTCQ